MTQMSLTELSKNASFDFEAFQKEAIEKLKNGQPLVGKDGVIRWCFKSVESRLDLLSLYEVILQGETKWQQLK